MLQYNRSLETSEAAKLFSHSRAVEAAMLFLKAAGSLQESSYSREPFPRDSRYFVLDTRLLSKTLRKTLVN